MKILLISPLIYPSEVGGLEIYNYYFIKELKKLGHNVSLLSNYTGLSDSGIKSYKLFTRNPFIQSIKIFFHLLSHKYDIVHIPYGSNSFLANPVGLFKKFFKKNDYAIYIHGGGMLKWTDPERQSLFFSKAKTIISVSEPIRKEYEQRTGRKITTVLPLIPFEKPKKSRIEVRKFLGIEEDDKVMIYVGSIKTLKGSDFLVNSFIKNGKEFFERNKLKMIFIGEGELKTQLNTLVEKNNMRKEIIFLGGKKKEEIPDYMIASDIFVFASEVEGTPLSLLEAMHNKLMVIATDVTGINNIIQNKVNGLLYKWNDFDSFRSALEFTLENNDECKKMIDFAKNITLKNYDYQKNILEHLRLYSEN
jgi:glycosyltransferase involved in cell wall biosynthesis